MRNRKNCVTSVSWTWTVTIRNERCWQPATGWGATASCGGRCLSDYSTCFSNGLGEEKNTCVVCSRWRRWQSRADSYCVSPCGNVSVSVCLSRFVLCLRRVLASSISPCRTHTPHVPCARRDCFAISEMFPPSSLGGFVGVDDKTIICGGVQSSHSLPQSTTLL